ncbi:MAG: filamentous hemagglutinin N-terminal domain-containing protein [Cocleimonas sp.]
MKNKINSINISFATLLLTLCYFTSPIVLSEITLDGSMGTTGSLVGPDYQITEDLGQRAGGNLFHSFGQFNINSAESATFSGSAGINNVISRVTGGQTSTIDGAFRSTIPGANVYFLNPSGVIFGENASLDVQGSFHASTADYLKFKDGGKFESGVATANPVLTTAAPEAFGFLDNTPAKIEILGGNNKLLKVPAGETLSLIGGDINIDDRSLYAPGGQVILASAGSTGELIFNESGIDTSSFTKGGNIHISHVADNPFTTIGNDRKIADIDVTANTGGKVFIRGGKMVMDNANIWAHTRNGNGGGIDIGLSGNLSINGVPEESQLEETPTSGLTVFALGKGNVGNIVLNIDELNLTHGTRISSLTGTSGKGGNLNINANSILLQGNNTKSAPYLSSLTTGTGDAGHIAINTNDLKMLDSGSIHSSVSETGQGRVGNISVEATNTISLNGSGVSITNFTLGSGHSGDITIESEKLDIRNGATINSFTSSSGNGGNLLVDSNEIVLTNDEIIPVTDIGTISPTGIISNIFDSNDIDVDHGNSGDIKISADNLTISNGAYVSTLNGGKGNGGDISIDSDKILLTNNLGPIPNFTGIEADVLDTGNGGKITVFSNELIINNGTEITTTTHDAGQGGDIEINSPTLVLIGDGSDISADTTFNTGNAGDIIIQSKHMEMHDGATLSTQTKGFGLGGDINVESSNILLSGDDTGLFTRSFATSMKDAGNITITSNHLEIRSGAVLNTTTHSRGIEHYINTVPFFKDIDLDSLPLDENKNSIGNGGKITLDINRLDIKDSLIDASTSGKGLAGDINVKAQTILISNNNTDNFVGIKSQAKDTSSGNAGNITINTGSIELHNNTGISSATLATGQAGNIEITADTMSLDNALIESLSTNPLLNIDIDEHSTIAKSGDILITINDALSIENSGAVTVTTAKANAGGIQINGSGNITLNDSEINTSVNDGKGSGGDISITTPIVALDSSNIIAQAKEGKGGNISVSNFLFQSPNSLVDASSKLSANGKLNLKPDTNISSSIAVLPETIMDTSNLLNDYCGTYSKEKSNSFVVKERGGIPLSPKELTPATFIDFSIQQVSQNNDRTQPPPINNVQLSSNNIPCVHR